MIVIPVPFEDVFRGVKARILWTVLSRYRQLRHTFVAADGVSRESEAMPIKVNLQRTRALSWTGLLVHL